uniref:Dynein heavy chain hydrolytic ATP-binding dynein motor region domain-containing protein n=1 Tax=Parascaris univalens TaxID=6257 RepID=A0A915BME7_PARUN
VALCVKDHESKNAAAMAVNAALTILSPAFTPSENSTFLRILKPITKTDRMARKDWIRNAAIAATNAKNLASEELFIEKCSQLYELLSFRSGVIVFGESMCGKSALIDVVAEMTRTGDRSTTITRINPSLVDSKSLYGYFDADMLEWVPGIFSHILGETVQKADRIQQWIVLDGKVHSDWIESMNSLLDDNRILCLANGQTIPLRDNVRIIFETDNLELVAATTVSRCGIVNMGPAVITTESLKLIASGDETVGSIQFLEKVHAEMTQLKEIVSVLEIKELRRRKLLITRMNALLRIWKNVDRCRRFHTLVVYLSAQCLISNEVLLRSFQMIDEDLPTLFDRFPRAEVDWLDLSRSRSSSPGIIPTEFQSVLIERLLKFGNPVLLYGHSHAGKSSLWTAFCRLLDPKEWNVVVLHLSSLVDSKSLLKGILHSQLVRVGGGHYMGAEGKSVLIILVGVNRLQVVGENSALELLRAIFERNCAIVNVTDEIRLSNVYFIGEFTTKDEQAVGIETDTRLERHWFPLWVGSHDKKVPVEVYKRIMSNYCSQFATANIKLFEDVIKTEFTRAIRFSPPLLSLEDSMMSEQLLNVANDERFVVNGLRHGPLVDLVNLKADLLQKQKDIEAKASVDTVISDYSSRHIALMLKVVHSDGGHCVLVGDEDLGQRDVCEFVADIF